VALLQLGFPGPRLRRPPPLASLCVSRWASGAEVAQPSSICGYEILGELGRGTSGVVYQARCTFVRPDRLVALKVPSFEPASEADLRLARYRRESHVLYWLSQGPDPAVPALYEIGGTADGRQHFIAREFINGRTLEELASARELGLREGIGILAAIAGIVRRVHGLGFVHRNLLPSNVLVDTGGAPRLIGFGLAGLITGSDKLPPGVEGESAEVDVRALQGMLGWLCTTLRHRVPIPLESVRQPGSVQSLASIEGTLHSYLQEESPA
jgi:serine/threonine protein kinase